MSRNSKSFISPNQSKTILQAQYEKIKPKILQKLADNQDGKPDIKAWVSNAVMHELSFDSLAHFSGDLADISIAFFLSDL